MSSSAVTKLARPDKYMRGMLIQQIKRNIILGGIFSTCTATLYWYFVARQRKINYEEFYKHYDADKDYERMKKLGLFNSAKP